MKIGFHFNADHPSLGCFYGISIYKEVFSKILQKRNLNISTKIFIGDLLFMLYTSDVVEDSSVSNDVRVTKQTYSFNQERYIELFNAWLYSTTNNWKSFDNEKLKEAINQNICVVCFESIDLNHTEYIDNALKEYPPYIGAMEVDESNKMHWLLYGNSLIPYGRLTNKQLNLFYELGDDDLDVAAKEEYKPLGFERVDFECLNYRYSIFDRYNNYEHARRVSEWKKGFGSLLAFVADDVVSRLSDIAPDLSNKLWAALSTFDNAETNEQLAQVMTSCRRIFEYITDNVFPPTNEPSDSGNSLKADKYIGGIYEYAKQSKLGNTNIDLIVASTDQLFSQWDKLNNLANKGVHSEVFRNETRRCFIRTILLLDDIISLNQEPFEITPDLDLSIILDKLKTIKY